MSNRGEVWPPDVAVIDPTPGAFPSTRPDASTSRTEVGVAVYAIFAFATIRPFTSRATVVSCTASPTAIVCFGAVMRTDKTDTPAGLSEQHKAGVEEAVHHCLIHNTLLHPPQISIEVKSSELLEHTA